MTRSTGASTQAEKTALPPQASSSFTRPEQPPQNSQGEIICDHINCSYKNIIFNTRHDWLQVPPFSLPQLIKHKNKHERPYKCTIDGCTRPEGFATKGDQLRHERTVHKAPNNLVGMEVSTNPSLFCDEPNCPRGPGTGISGFNRRDNLLDHMRRRHGRAFASSRAAAVNSLTPPDKPTPALPQLEDQQVTSLVAVSGKRRRSPATSMLVMNEIQGTNPPKKPRQEESSPQIAMEQTLRDENLVREIERLRKELEKAQKEKDVLMGVIDHLMQRPT
ncbi:hypothetical protein NA56DRAFT_572356 [Hyaloscypha hepaticicola]|uniref:C2H2-type domain-containing protein n=1 Tax=Hyaloscypha hepaticicola TaxID=2082293 RepID=A0A2J6Q5H1_9HELO|nr:hypothetical protein NA56DRAFT_572356 [Hyaloscypha hepaticicola]